MLSRQQVIRCVNLSLHSVVFLHILFGLKHVLSLFQTLSIIISLRVCGIRSEGFHLFVRNGVSACGWVMINSDISLLCCPKIYLTLPTPVFRNDLNEDFLCCEREGQQQGADTDAPWSSTGDRGVRTKYSLQGELYVAEVSGYTAQLKNHCGVCRSYRRSA